MSDFTLIIKDSKEPKPEKVRVNITRLSYAAGYSKSHISRVFSGKTVPSVGCLVKIAQAMGIEMGTLHDLIEKGRINVIEAS